MKQKFINNYWWYMPGLLGMLSFAIVQCDDMTFKAELK